MSFPGFPAPPGGGGSPPSPSQHNLLSSTHGDTTPASPLAGDIVISSTGVFWEKLAAGTELDHLVIVGGVPTWSAQAGSGLGDVTGPAGANDNYVSIYDGISGKLIKQGLVTIDEFGNLTSEGSIVASGGITSLGDIFVNNNLGVGGNTVISGDLTVLGSIVGFDLAASGFVVGPASATDSAIALYDGTTGKLIKNSNVTIDASGNIFTSGNIVSSGPTIVSVSSGTAPVYNITNISYNAITSATTGVILPPSPTLGQQHIIKDIDGVAGTSPITIDGNGDTIDGQSTFELSSDYEAITLIFGPTEWNII